MYGRYGMNFAVAKERQRWSGTLVVIDPAVLVPVLATWVVVLVLSGFVGLSTMSAGVAAPVYLALTELPDAQPVFIYCVSMAAYIVFCHRSNIARMRAGTENRVTRAMLFGNRHA